MAVFCVEQNTKGPKNTKYKESGRGYTVPTSNDEEGQSDSIRVLASVRLWQYAQAVMQELLVLLPFNVWRKCVVSSFSLWLLGHSQFPYRIFSTSANEGVPHQFSTGQFISQLRLALTSFHLWKIEGLCYVGEQKHSRT